MTDTPMVLVPREATGAMAAVGTEARWRSAVRDADSVRDIHAAMLDASPASGKVTEEQVEKMAEAMWQDESVRASGRFRLIDWSEESDKEKDKWRSFARAALASIGLEVE